MNDTPTPRTDANDLGWQFHEQYDYFDSLSDTPMPWLDFSKMLEEELAAVTEQRDGLRSGIDYASDQLTRVTEQRDKALQKIKNQAERIAYLEGATNHATGTPLSKAIEQRDRLAEALRKIENASEGYTDPYQELDYIDGITYKALQSLPRSYCRYQRYDVSRERRER